MMVISPFFSFLSLMVWFFYFFSCVSEPFFFASALCLQSTV
jgi:hypothetical protein